MKKHIVLGFLLLLSIALLAKAGTISLQPTETSVQLLRSSDNGLSVRYSIDEILYQEVNTPSGVYTDINLKYYANTNITGEPRLPLMRQVIQVPLGAEVIPTIVAKEQMILSMSRNGINYPIFPRQESVSKSADPSTLPFVVKSEAYNLSRFTDVANIRVEELGMLRGVRLVALDYVPIRYNPLMGELEIITNATVEVEFRGADFAATEALRAKTFSQAFEPIYGKTVLNYHQTRLSLNRYPLGYVIITPQMFVSTLQPFVDWKKREGFNVIVATTEQIGATTNAIKTYLQGLWDGATATNPAPSYVLFVGDTPQVPSNTGQTGTGHVTDLSYVRLQGTDYMPEMYYGRFSATNVNELQPQIDKSMMHQQYTMPDDSYLAQTVLIAGMDSSFGNSHGNGQINYGITNYFNTANGITSSNFMYPQSGSQASAIVSAVSQGKGYVNYTAHGSETSWADPSFTIQNINSLQNANKYPVVVGNCCITNHFNTALCFGEAWLRAANKGAVIYIGGTNNTYWDEDYYWGVGYKPPVVSTGSPFVANRTGVYDALFHTHNEPFADWAGSAGAMIVMGNLAVAQSNSSRINYYWEIYSIMGDPSTVPYMGIPAQNTTNYQDTIFLGVGSLQISADPFTYVAISMNNVLHGVGLADASGQLNLTFTPFDTPGTAQLVFTRSMRKPLIANLQVVPNQGPYVIATGVIVNDGNNNIAEAGETINLGVSFNNVGVQNATNVTATLSSTNPYVNIIQNATAIAEVPANSTINVDNAFTLAISPMIPDQEQVNLTITMVSGTNTWTSNRSFIVNAPNMQITGLQIADANANTIIEPGENITVQVTLNNTGHMGAESGTLQIIANNPHISVTNETMVIPAVGIGTQIPISIPATVSASATEGSILHLGLAFTSGAQMLNYTVAIPVGMVGEGFESGTFTAFPWVNTSTQPWTIVQGTGNVQAGTYAAKSGAISHNQNTALQVTINVAAAGNISFWRKVSSEQSYDFLKFFIDGTETGSWSGTQDWQQVTYPVNAGNRTFRWVYSKDGSVNGGTDSAWIDEIRFPMSGSSDIAMLYVPTESIEMLQVPLNTTVSADFAVRNLGNVALNGMIAIPNGFTLSHNGETLPPSYAYEVEAMSSKVFTLSYTTGATGVVINDEITITSNDQYNPVYAIAVTLQTSSSNPNDGLIPALTALEGNYPNPFNPETAIRFSLKEAAPVRINIFNIKGQLVQSLVNSDLQAGYHKVVWNGKDSRGNRVSSGIYMYRMETPKYTKTMKMMLMK